MESLPGTLKPLTLLEHVAAMDRAPTLADIAMSTLLPKPTLHRWLAMLESAGLLQRTPDARRYELAARASQFAFAILSNRPGAALRHDILQRVVKEVGESCNLTVLHGTQVVYLDRVESMWPLRITFQSGSKVPAHCSASGKLFLALMPPAKRNLVLQALSFERFTANTLVNKTVLGDQLRTIRRQHYALDREEYLPGLVCLAVPIYRGEGRSRKCVASLALQAPVARLPYENLPSKLPVLQDAARSLAASLD
jgi:DNA-binding IclR family transcriptional regulator